MDGQRPMEELSEARNLEKVLSFRDAREGDRDFAVEEIIDQTRTTITTVLRTPRVDDDVDQRKLCGREDWEEFFADILPSVENEYPKPDRISKGNPSPTSRLFLIIARPEKTENRVLRPTDTLVEGRCSGVDINDERLGSWFLSRGRRVTTVAASFFRRGEDILPNEKAEARPASDFKVSVSKTPRGDHRKRLRNMPFTADTFRLLSRRMSIHSWIGRLISRANVPAFERTLTEMPLYTSTGESMVRQKAIIYNCRTSNEWKDDMALAVTHFPKQRLTFALLFGASEDQERSVLARLGRAGPDTAHPMLLPGILVELERKRQMDIADEMIDELEMQIFQLDNETITSWKQSVQTTAERNKQKTKAWLDAAFSRNILLATKTVLFSMCRHLDEYSMLVNPRVRREHDFHHQDRDHFAQGGLRPGTPLSVTSSHWQVHSQISFSEYSGSEPLEASNPDSTCDPDARYQELLQQAGMRMEDRLVSIIGEYEDKIRACTMEIDGMAMATQWSHGETNMEIATASGEDSRQMRSIALVTMVFLPGTFFASMFSMTFFNWNAGSDGGGGGGNNSSPTVSSEIWIYFLITAVSTLITLLLFWYFILSRQRNRRKLQRDLSSV
ncbi:hypothetical protein N657DRAFT_650634 [Parathielavia appendiculata]|uniref:Uncharacterized protein n=1 Tax=Parathielavia appendiculata TaxID=2587402 RepID=A0AAN6YZ94_9PEZI|nr:hypothetical protein N657DRAFT_650634 [Parathielavia appendiculata]